MNKKNISKDLAARALQQKVASNIRSTRSSRRRDQGGQVIIGALLLFLTISITVLVGIATPVAIQVRSAADFLQSKQGYISADVLNEEALYRLNKGKTLPSSLVLSFNQSTSTALISYVGSKIQVMATGISGLFTRMSQSIFTQGQGSFGVKYGVQAGTGGISMSGSPTITGDVISNGDIVGSGVSTINGAVTSAALVPQIVDSAYGAAGNNPMISAQIGYGLSSSVSDMALSFTVSTTTPLSRIALSVLKVGAPASLSVYITASSGSNPAASALASGTLNASQVTNAYAWVPVTFNSKISLTPGVTYWIVVDAVNASIVNYYLFGGDPVPAGAGNMKSGKYRGSWGGFNLFTAMKGYFQTYLGGASTISGVVINGNTNGYVVNSSTVSGTLYCQSGTGNNKSCNASTSTPNAITYPFSDTNISSWKTEATNGGIYNGNLTIGGVMATTTGPLKINGNLTVTNSGILTMSGTLYVTGNITIDGAGKLKADSSYGAKSAVVVSDGKINIASGYAGNPSISGSGTAGSYVMFATTNNCNGTVSCGSDSASAINISGAATAIVLFAPNGKVYITGSGEAKSVISYALKMDGGTKITYDSGLSSLNFGESVGGSSSWITDTWKEISN